MLFSLLEQPPENEANAVFICKTNLMNSSRLMILLDLIKAVVSQAESLLLLLRKGLVFLEALLPSSPRAQPLARIMESWPWARHGAQPQTPASVPNSWYNPKSLLQPQISFTAPNACYNPKSLFCP